MQTHEAMWHVASGIHKSQDRARRRQREKRDAYQDTLLDNLHVEHCHKSAKLQMHQVTVLICFYVSGLVLAGDPCQVMLGL